MRQLVSDTVASYQQDDSDLFPEILQGQKYDTIDSKNTAKDYGMTSDTAIWSEFPWIDSTSRSPLGTF
jgi:hypothetical protein